MTSRAPPPEPVDGPRDEARDQACASEEGLLTVDSAWIFSGRQEVAIRHNGRTYRLRCTRLGKLILTA